MSREPAAEAKPRRHGQGLALSVLQMLCCKGRRRPGKQTGITFPIKLGDLTGSRGPELLTRMLRHGGHLPSGVTVTSIRDAGVEIRDGVKGDKGVIEVEYSGPAELPRQFFAKFNLQALSALPMRLMGEVSEVCRCEAWFYQHLAAQAPIPSPRCYFADVDELSGEFVLLSELVRFGEAGVLPLKHRVRHETTLEEQRLFITAGARLNAHFWGAGHPALEGAPRFEETHRRFWTLTQLIARRGLRHTAERTLRGRRVNEAFMTWRPPPELLGKERELIEDMPDILRDLCADGDMVAYGHNDCTTDNAFFTRTKESLTFGLFDWQQSCVNNVGQEWAWNLHFLLPEFLEEHEEEFLELILRTYAEQGVQVSRERFLEAYVLGTVQMYVFGGGGIQLVLGSLDRMGLFGSMVPEDPRCSDEALDKGTREKIVGAEMTRRTLTNVCGIMRRHGFVRAWRSWRERKGRPALGAPCERPFAGGARGQAACRRKRGCRR